MTTEMNQAFSAFMSIPPEVIENNILKYLTCEDVRSFALFGSLIGNKKLHDIAFRVEKNRKWFQRPKYPFQAWRFTRQAVNEIAASLGNIDGFATDAIENHQTDSIKDTVQEDESSRSQYSILNHYLQKISEHEAPYPGSQEAKSISSAIEKTLENMTKELKERYKLFQGCQMVKVGSSIEGLKIGLPDEFDYSIVLPKMSECIKLKHSLHNNSVSNAINAAFFPEILNYDSDEEDRVYFTMENMEIMEDILPREIFAKEGKENVDTVGRLYETALENELGGDGWSEVLGPILSMPQRSEFEQIFKAIDKLMEEFLGRHLAKGLSIIRKEPIRKFRSLNKPAFTSKLLWEGKEFPNLEIDVDIAFIIPMKEKPLFHNFPLYLNSTKETILPEMVSLNVCDEDSMYILQSYKSCSLTHGMEEAKMFQKLPNDSIVHQCIRVCKKLRDTFMTHFFDIESETLRPVLKTYWIKSVAMYVFKDYLLGDRTHVPVEPELKGAVLSEYVMKVLELLNTCLSCDHGKTNPFMSSFNIPFKNILHSKLKLDADEAETPYLDQDQIDILCRPSAVAANDINHLLSLLGRLKLNDKDAELELEKSRNLNSESKNVIYKEGLKEKLGILLYKHFEMEDPDVLASNDKPYYMEYIRINFSSMEVIQLEEGEEDEIEYEYIVTSIPIRLIEDGEDVDIGELLAKARNRINYFQLDLQKNMTSDFHQNDFNF